MYALDTAIAIFTVYNAKIESGIDNWERSCVFYFKIELSHYKVLTKLNIDKVVVLLTSKMRHFPNDSLLNLIPAQSVKALIEGFKLVFT